MSHRLDFRQPGVIDSHQRGLAVEVPEKGDDFLRGASLAQARVNRAQDAPSNRQQVRREGETALFESQRLKHLRDVPVSEEPISAAVFVYFREVKLFRGRPARAARSRLRVADDSGTRVQPVSLDEGR